MQAERLAQTPLDAVPVDAPTDRPGNGETQAGPFTAVWTREAKGGEQGAGNARAVVIYSSEVGGAQSPW